MSLFDIIHSAVHSPKPSDIEQLRKYVLSHPEELNQVDLHGKTACHYALSNFPLLEVLALEGKRAHLPENMTTDETLLKKINELRKEQARIKKYHGFHLHDIVRRTYPIKNIELHCRNHKNEINETSYMGRNACHWAAKMNRPDYLELFAQLNGNLTAIDCEGKTPLDLATNDDTKNTIKRLIDKSSNTNNVIEKAPQTQSKHTGERNQDSIGVLNRIKDIKSAMSRALSPQRDNVGARPESDSYSLRRSHKNYEQHPITKSPPLSPREKANPKQITSTQPRGILKTSQLKTHLIDTNSSAIDNNDQTSTKHFEFKNTLMNDNLDQIAGSRTNYVAMPSVTTVSNNDRLIPPQNHPLSPINILATQTESVTTNTMSSGSNFVAMPNIHNDITDNTGPGTHTTKNEVKRKQIRFAGFSEEENAQQFQMITHTDNQQNEDTQHNILNVIHQPSPSSYVSVDNAVNSANTPTHEQSVTESVNKTKNTIDTPDENSVRQLAADKFGTNSFFNSAERLITIFKSDNLEEFLAYCEQRKTNPNHKLSGFGRPYILQAFLSNAGRIFIYLLQQGAKIDSLTKSGKTFTDYITEDNKEDRITFLKQVQQGISNKVSTSRISNDRERSNQAEKDFMQKLAIDGFNKPFTIKSSPIDNAILSDISNKHQISLQIVQTLYDLCIGICDVKGKSRIELKEKITADHDAKKTEIGIYNLDLIKTFTVFLLANNEPHIIIAILQDLYPYLIQQQQQITYFIVKEMILMDKFHHCYRNKHFCEEVLPAFIKAITRPDKLDGYSLHLNAMIKLQNKIENPIVRANTQIDIIIAKFDNRKQNALQKDFKLFAADLTALIHLHLQTFNMKEWLNQGWTKENKYEIAPNLVEITALFNKISDYVVISILESRNTKERLSNIEFFIRTLNELINNSERPCDLQSAMAISSALSNSIMKKYLKEFKLQDGKTYQLWKNAQIILDNKDNFKVQRNLIDNTNRVVYPFFGTLALDLTMKAENTNLKTKALNEGSVYQKIIKLKDSLRSIPTMELHSNLAYVLHNQKEMTDADFELIEMKNNTLPINLNSTLTIAHLINLIDVYCNKKFKLKVSFIQNLAKQEAEGLAAIESIFSWIKEEISVHKVNQKEIDILVKKMELLPNANKIRIEFLRATYLKWLNLQLAIKAAHLKNKPLPSGSNQDAHKKEKEHADDDTCVRNSNRP